MANFLFSVGQRVMVLTVTVLGEIIRRREPNYSGEEKHYTVKLDERVGGLSHVTVPESDLAPQGKDN